MRSLSQDPVLWNLVKIVCACASFCWGKIYQVLSFTRGQSYKTYAKFSERAESCSVIKKEILAQAFSCEFWEIFNNTFSAEHSQESASKSSDFVFQVVSIKACKDQA